MSDARSHATHLESHAVLPPDADERFVGYGVMAQPFASGHILALRRFTITSVGPAYTSIWHRDPDGRWTFRITGEPFQCCNRYFGSAVDETIQGEIALDWTGPGTLVVTTADEAIRWTIAMASTPITRMMSVTGSMIPNLLWRQRFAPIITGGVASGMLRTGRMVMTGDVPNGQRFLMNPPRLWTVADTEATVNGHNLGGAGSLQVQENLRDFWLPQRGLFYAGSVSFEPFDATRHQLATDRAT